MACDYCGRAARALFDESWGSVSASAHIDGPSIDMRVMTFFPDSYSTSVGMCVKPIRFCPMCGRDLRGGGEG
nr:MAG TPA: tax1-binding protein [Caudoviricetes sp.]